MKYSEQPVGHETQIKMEEVSPLNRAIESFDIARREFLVVCSDFANNPSDQAKSNLCLCGSVMTKMFGNSVEALWEAEPNETLRVRMIANLITEEDADRVDLFREKTHCEGFEYVSGQDHTDTTATEEALTDIAIDVGTADLPDAISKIFFNNLQEDLSHFAQHAIENYVPPEAEADMKRIIAKSIGSHMLDIGKVALGTAIGIWVMHNRKPS